VLYGQAAQYPTKHSDDILSLLLLHIFFARFRLR
jgi:hypothetical protein